MKSIYAVSTGYYAKVHGKHTMVHLVDEGKPMCGYKPAKSMQFQCCAPFPHLEYVECKKCKEKFEKKYKMI
jgi:hypothetical protein